MIGNIIVGGAVLILVCAVIVKLIKDKKNGKGCCSGGCSSCNRSCCNKTIR